jgi:hypothetical protein
VPGRGVCCCCGTSSRCTFAGGGCPTCCAGLCETKNVGFEDGSCEVGSMLQAVWGELNHGVMQTVTSDAAAIHVSC